MASPAQHPTVSGLVVAYNEIEAAPAAESTGMDETWKQWEGQIVDGKFPLQEFLAESDHSVVFLTVAGEPPQKAAIKLIPADSGNAERQLSRWQSAGRLSHPHLVRIFQAGRCELGGMALLYAVLEYADEDLSQILPERALTPAEAREMLDPVVDTLSYLHGKGFVHGHVKPTNIMVVADQLKLSSDALSQIGEREQSRERGPYDPPEIATNGPSAAGDIWSLGTTLVESLTQRLPVTADNQKPVLSDLPQPFLEIAAGCLRLDAQERMTTAEISAKLHPVTRVQPEPAVVKPAPEVRTAPAAGRRRYLPSVLIAAALAVILFVVFRGRRSQTPEDQSVPAASTQTSVQPEPKPAPATRPARHTQATNKAAPAAGVVHRVLPNVSQSARNTIQGNIRVSVRVSVDPSGNVTQAALASSGPSKYFARLAVQAAQEWKFAPAQVNGQAVSSEWLLRFAFGPNSTDVTPARVAP